MSRAHRNRDKERKRMKELDPTEMPDGVYYSCSDGLEHDESCHEIPPEHDARQYGYTRLFTKRGQELGCIEVTKWDVAIKIEQDKWMELGVNPGAIQLDGIQADAKLVVLFDIFEFLFDVSRHKMDEMYQQTYLKKLQQAREGVEPAIHEARRSQIAARPGAIIGPDGKPMKLN